jgi:hypothetical protein
MQGLISRVLADEVRSALDDYPVVALIGPRQSGKSTLAGFLTRGMPGAISLDLESPADRAVLVEAEAFFDAHADSLICLDEVQRLPEIFPLLRHVVDGRRRNGCFLLLGSASRELIESASESLAGRIKYIELSPFLLDEAESAGGDRVKLWMRGGFPRSLLAASERASMDWRQEFIRSFLERDLLQLRARFMPERARRLWTMVAHGHGQLLNKSQLAVSLDVDAHTVGSYLDILEAAFMIRRIPPFHANRKKRLVKSPKIYVRDSGILHALLGIPSYRDLLAHPLRGFSWEGFVMDQILPRLQPLAQATFYRTATGAEVDLLLELGSRRAVIEIKASSSPKLEKGFWTSLEDLKPDQVWVVAPVERKYSLSSEKKINAVSVADLVEECRQAGWMRM